MLPRRALLLLAAITGCTAPSAPNPPPSTAPPAAPIVTHQEEQVAAAEGDEYEWADATRSPRPPAVVEGSAARLSATCDAADPVLTGVAQRIAERLVAGGDSPDANEVTFALRAGGAPYVWPRTWTLSGGKVDPTVAEERARAWLDAAPRAGYRLCGPALVASPEGDAAVLVAADVLADLAPVPVRSRIGKWLRIEAIPRVPTSQAKVVALGPRGSPQNVPTALGSGRIVANFAPSVPGPWTLQVLADVPGGPRPVAEAMVFVDAAPARHFRATPAVGESAGNGAPDPATALFRMINHSRHAEGLTTLRRDPRLDALAQAHAEAMQRAGRLGHDVGDGDTRARFEGAGLGGGSFGENVSRALSTQRAHRAIWSSPSHRGNLLSPRYTSVGVGVVPGDGAVWVCEIFADFR